MSIKNISILGSTGSIGRNTLDVIRMHRGRFRVMALSGGSNIGLLKEQAEEFRPVFISAGSVESANALKKSLTIPVEVGSGAEGAIRAAAFEGVDMVVSAISGAAGLLPTMAALKAGKDLALANKEALVLAGSLVIDEAQRRNVNIIPVDSEHSAVFQSLLGHRKEDVKRLILTASGGPFLTTSIEKLERMSPEEALNHPRWKMGRKISIDSATLFNKGLEVIEARWLFGLPPEQISVVIHPQSIVHSMVEYVDGSVISQMSTPDMRGAISYALSYPERLPGGVRPLDFSRLTLEFSDPDAARFPCLGLAYQALAMGGTAPAILNAADEVAVGLFLEGKIPFTGIYRVMAEVLDGHASGKVSSLEDVCDADRTAREAALKAASAISNKA